jgi:hypothetical protein
MVRYIYILGVGIGLNSNFELIITFWFEYEMSPTSACSNLNAWSPASSTILGGCGNLRRWGLAGGSRSLGVGLEYYT